MSSQESEQTQVEFDLRTEELLINMGPQHPSTHGVLRLLLQAKGEVITSAEPHIGYLHRSAEKIGENVTARQWIPYTDRLDYLAAMNMNLGWAMTVEKLLGLELPEKAKHLSLRYLDRHPFEHGVPSKALAHRAIVENPHRMSVSGGRSGR